MTRVVIAILIAIVLNQALIFCIGYFIAPPNDVLYAVALLSGVVLGWTAVMYALKDQL